MKITLPSGTEIYANSGIVGIDEEGVVFGGYDNRIFDHAYPDYFDDNPQLSIDDQISLAEIMIKRWSLFKKRALSEKK